jgi:hypothetical protein
MAKRFTDTNKYKKPFVRGLPGPYKLLWDFLYHDCDHAGIWIVDFKIAQIYLGEDMPVNRDEALKLFNAGEERVVEFDNGKKWFVKPFIDFQYGELREENRLHKSVLEILRSNDLIENTNKVLASPLQGAKDKDKEKDKEKGKAKTSENDFEKFWQAYPKKKSKGQAKITWQKLKKCGKLPELSVLHDAIAAARQSQDWQRDAGQFIPHPSTWLNAEGWLDEHGRPKTQEPVKRCFVCKKIADGTIPCSGDVIPCCSACKQAIAEAPEFRRFDGVIIPKRDLPAISLRQMVEEKLIGVTNG